jgi:hypothetical protein
VLASCWTACIDMLSLGGGWVGFHVRLRVDAAWNIVQVRVAVSE